ncbi:hypothetical protein GJ689_24655 [Rhodoplanes serenus]|uniref:Uncharacterized protein n=1 Tax=Rhodoplanes serenus TaxID=200615 RepID=A0A9X5AVC9_9BRAD|nr:hypothetical protein [Rhodoplanes serenus]MTW19385.1 hypothetical protein [Rhodoplanes serenus]
MADASELYEVARLLRRLDPPDRRRPHRFAEDKSELARRLEVIARAIGAKPVPIAGAGQPTVVVIGQRRVVVQRKRAGFGLG